MQCTVIQCYHKPKGGTTMNIGQNIAKYRKQRKLTQEQLGEKLGVTNQAVSKWESGASLPDVILMPVLADTLGITLDDLYGMGGEKTKITADEFPLAAQRELHKLFYKSTRMRFKHIDSSDETQMKFQVDKLQSGCRIGCISNDRGAFVMTDDFSFIDCSYKAPESESCIRPMDVGYILSALSDNNVCKTFSVLYRESFKRSKETSSEYSFEEIKNLCNIDNIELLQSLRSLKEIKVIEDYPDHNTKMKMYQFCLSTALYVIAIYKLAAMLEEDPCWAVVRDTSMISDYAF